MSEEIPLIFPNEQEGGHIRIQIPDISSALSEERLEMPTFEIVQGTDGKIYEREGVTYEGIRLLTMELPNKEILSYCIVEKPETRPERYAQIQRNVISLFKSASIKELSQLQKVFSTFGEEAYGIDGSHSVPFYAAEPIKIEGRRRLHHAVLINPKFEMTSVREFAQELENLYEEKLQKTTKGGRRSQAILALDEEQTPEELLETFRQPTPTGIEDYVAEEGIVMAMRRIIRTVDDPDTFHSRKMIVLEGNPGTGKTLFAKTLAHEIKAKFYRPTFSKVGSVYQAAAGLRVDAIFDAIQEEIKKNKVVLLIDELDGMGTDAEGAYLSDNAQGMRQALLTRLDGLEDPNLVVIGTTNKGGQIDQALLRPGRLDAPIIMNGFTTLKVKEQAMTVFMRQKAEDFGMELDNLFAGDVDAAWIASQLPTGELPGAFVQDVITKANDIREDRIDESDGLGSAVITREDISSAIKRVFPQEPRMGF